MRKKIVLIAGIGFLLICLAGCGNSAETTPQQKPGTTVEDNNTEMTASERRVLASRLSKMAENVEGVDRASIIVSSIGLTNIGMGTTDNTTNNTNSTSKTGTNNSGGTSNTGIANNNTGGSTANTGANTGTANNNNSATNNSNYSGQVVMVGLTLEASAVRDPATVNKVKMNVVNQLKASDKRISQVLVTTDPEVIERINNVAAAIIEGKPIQNYKSDINDIGKQLKSDDKTPAF